MIIVADSIARKPSNTDMSFDFVASLASALAGKIIRSPIHIIIPTAIKKAISCILSTINWISCIKSDQGFVTSRFGHDPSWIPPVGKHLSKSDLGSSLYTHSAKTVSVLMANIQRIHNIFFILMDIEIR